LADSEGGRMLFLCGGGLFFLTNFQGLAAFSKNSRERKFSSPIATEKYNILCARAFAYKQRERGREKERGRERGKIRRYR
jgi:hypothetical protein